MIILKRTTSDDKDFSSLITRLDLDLQSRYGSTQDEFDQYNVIENLHTVVIVYEDHEPLGCGCFKKFSDDTVELKRMYVTNEQRGKGIGALVLTELEKWIVELDYNMIVLETGTKQPEAIQLYKKQGYRIIPNYAPYTGNDLSICMKKQLLRIKLK